MADVHEPLAHEVARHLFATEVQPQDVRHLRGEDGDRYTTGKAHHNGVGDELDDRSQAEQPQRYKDDARHERGHQQAGLAVLLDDTIHYDDECPRGPAYLHAAAAQQRHDEACDDGGDDALLGRHAGGDAKGYGQRKGHDAYDDACHDVGRQVGFRVLSQGVEQFGFELESFHCCLSLFLVQWLFALRREVIFYFEGAKIVKILHHPVRFCK